MTKTEIVHNLKDQMVNYYRSAAYWTKQDDESARVSALRDADSVFWTGLALLGDSWADRLRTARSEAVDEAYELQH